MTLHGSQFDIDTLKRKEKISNVLARNLRSDDIREAVSHCKGRDEKPRLAAVDQHLKCLFMSMKWQTRPNTADEKVGARARIGHKPRWYAHLLDKPLRSVTFTREKRKDANHENHTLLRLESRMKNVCHNLIDGA